MRWRLGISLLTVLTSAIAVGAAVLGPLYLQTAGDSVVRSTIASAPIEGRGTTLAQAPGQTASINRIESDEQLVERAGGDHRFFGAPITTVVSGVGLVSPRAGPVRSQLLSRTGICGVLRFRQGGCNLGFGDVAVSDRSARELGVSVGAVIDASVQGATQPLRLRVTGIYAVPNVDLPYWWGNATGYFSFGQETSGAHRFPELDSLVASRQTALAVPPQDAPELVGQVPLRTAGAGLDQESSLRAALSGATSAVNAHGGVALSTQLPSLLTRSDGQRHVMSTIVAVAAIQLVLLAIWVLGGVLVRSSDARRAEIRVARLRGFPPISMLAITALEPGVLCLLGLALGVGAAWAAVTVARNRLLDPAAVISPDIWVFAAFAASVVAIVCVLAIGTLRLLRSSGLSETPAAGRGLRPRAALMADTVLLVLAVVALIALATNGSLSGHDNPIASAAPGLIALGTAVLAVQLVLFVCRQGVSASAFSARIAVFLALRGIVRRPTVMRQTRVLIIALCLACFAISAWSVARTNRAAAAAFGVGSREVVSVTPNGASLEQAVDRVDPRGHFAMAAVTVVTTSSTVLAVQAQRLAAVMPWPQGISRRDLSTVSRLLNPATARPVNLAGGPVRLFGDATLIGQRAQLGALDVGLWVSNPQVGTAIVDLGSLHGGGWTYEGNLAVACPGGCRLVGVGLVPAPGRNAPSSGTARLTISGLSARSASGGWKPVPADLMAQEWRPTAGGVQVRSVRPGTITVLVPAAATAAYTGAEGYAIPPMVSVADHPEVLPGVVTSELQSFNGGAGSGAVVPGQGLDGGTVNVSSAVTASALPRMGDNAIMVDLDLLARSQTDPTTPDVTDQVWLGQGAPDDALARLSQAGLHIDAVDTASAALTQLERSAPALADDFFLVATIVALFAAAASTLGALGADTRQRATELTALEVGGVSRRSLARSLALESTALAVTALFGIGAGVLAAMMAIPSLPELGSPSIIPLQYGLPAGWVAAVGAAVVAVIVLATVAVAAVLVRRMSPVLLRMAPNDSTG